MTEIIESCAIDVSPDHSGNEPADSERVKVRASVFFDGTLNNRINTLMRKDALLNPGNFTSRQRSKAKKAQSSYANEESNVSILERNLRNQAANYDHFMQIYVEGIGTEDFKKDSLIGKGLGMSVTGVLGKVTKGLTRVANIIQDKVSKDKVIALVTVDAFGFSRGAAAARNFVHRSLFDDFFDFYRTKALKKQLEMRGFKVEKVEIGFVGLFDTVASYGLPKLDHPRNTSYLRMDSVRHAKQVVQLAASEEYRENFALTTIESALESGCGKQVFLPGAHSDIGGGYAYGPETHEIFEASAQVYGGSYSAAYAQMRLIEQAEKEAQAFRNELIKLGWYRDDELVLEYRGASVVLKSNRAHVSNKYSRIPMYIMADFAEKSTQSLLFLPKLKVINPIPRALSDWHSELDKYAQGSDSIADDWMGVKSIKAPALDLGILRNKFLHYSVNTDSIGMGPNVSQGVRRRLHRYG